MNCMYHAMFTKSDYGTFFNLCCYLFSDLCAANTYNFGFYSIDQKQKNNQTLIAANLIER